MRCLVTLILLFFIIGSDKLQWFYILGGKIFLMKEYILLLLVHAFFSRSLLTLRTQWIKYQVEEEASPRTEKGFGGWCQLMPDEDKESTHLIFTLQAEAFLGVHTTEAPWITSLLAGGGFIWPPGFVCMHIFLEYIWSQSLKNKKHGFFMLLWNTIFEEHWFRTCQNDMRGPLFLIFFW